jgi:DNA cross-link repair 1A protein
MDCTKFIPTVNVGSKASRDKMQIWINKWQEERKRRRQNGDPLMIPHRTLQYW